MKQMTASGRDMRLDFFRGLALVFIYLNHIPGNAVSWLSNRNYGFSDATEIFVFISGYAAAIAYGRAMQRQGFALAGARILKRCWQLYTAHIFLFVVFTAQIAWAATRFSNPLFTEEMGIVGFLNEPHINLLQALVLKFRPANMDVLPLYILLLLAFPLLLAALLRAPLPTVAASALLWLVAARLGWNLPLHPEGTWLFNPLCWQFLFVLGAWLALTAGPLPWLRRFASAVDVIAFIYVLFSLYVVLSWQPAIPLPHIPDAFARFIYPVSKPDLDPLRLLHFLAMAWLAARLIRADAAFLRHPALRWLIRCGQNSLECFCIGVFLSFTAHFFLTEFDASFGAQFGASLAGVAIMSIAAAVLAWYRGAEKGKGAAMPGSTA